MEPTWSDRQATDRRQTKCGRDEIKLTKHKKKKKIATRQRWPQTKCVSGVGESCRC